jgi:hypothetical protein
MNWFRRLAVRGPVAWLEVKRNQLRSEKSHDLSSSFTQVQQAGGIILQDQRPYFILNLFEVGKPPLRIIGQSDPNSTFFRSTMLQYWTRIVGKYFGDHPDRSM